MPRLTRNSKRPLCRISFFIEESWARRAERLWKAAGFPAQSPWIAREVRGAIARAEEEQRAQRGVASPADADLQEIHLALPGGDVACEESPNSVEHTFITEAVTCAACLEHLDLTAHPKMEGQGGGTVDGSSGENGTGAPGGPF